MMWLAKQQPQTAFVTDRTEHPQAAALSNAMAARPFHAILPVRPAC
jgi:hypothetical protein